MPTSTSVDHYKVYSLFPEPVGIPNVAVEDQFGLSLVNLDSLAKLGVPVSKAIAPDPPAPLPGGLLRPNEHLAWYEFFEPQPIRQARVKNQFESENKGALWFVGDGHFLLVPAEVDFVPGIELGQHWKCYDAVTFFDPDVTVNLLDQFHLEPNVVVGPGRYLCNPVDKNFEGPPPLPDQHLACYDIVEPPLGQFHFLEDQFGPHDAFVENPELLCLPSLKFFPATFTDFDGDGVGDALDNCSDAVNTAQDDTDADDCGNLCDCDYDQSGVCGFSDFGAVIANFGSSDELYCHVEPIPGCVVGFASFGFIVSNFGSSPGPSGTTAGTTACP